MEATNGRERRRRLKDWRYPAAVAGVLFALVVLVALFSLLSRVDRNQSSSAQLLCIKRIDAAFDEAIIELLLKPPEERDQQTLVELNLEHILDELKRLDEICPGPS